LKLKHDELLSSFGFNCKLRHYVKGLQLEFEDPAEASLAYKQVRPVRVDPGFSQLTPRLRSALESKNMIESFQTLL